MPQSQNACFFVYMCSGSLFTSPHKKHGFECRAVAFATARHHRRGSAVKQCLVRE